MGLVVNIRSLATNKRDVWEGEYDKREVSDRFEGL